MAARVRSAAARWLDPLRNRLMLLFGILVLPPTLVSVAASFDAHNEMVARVRENAEHFAVLASTYERNLVDQSQNLLENVAGDPAVRSFSAAHKQGCDKLLRAVIEPNPIYASLIFFGRDGSVRCSSDPAYAEIHVGIVGVVEPQLRTQLHLGAVLGVVGHDNSPINPVSGLAGVCRVRKTPGPRINHRR